MVSTRKQRLIKEQEGETPSPQRALPQTSRRRKTTKAVKAEHSATVETRAQGEPSRQTTAHEHDNKENFHGQTRKRTENTDSEATAHNNKQQKKRSKRVKRGLTNVASDASRSVSTSVEPESVEELEEVNTSKPRKGKKRHRQHIESDASSEAEDVPRPPKKRNRLREAQLKKHAEDSEAQDRAPTPDNEQIEGTGKLLATWQSMTMPSTVDVPARFELERPLDVEAVARRVNKRLDDFPEVRDELRGGPVEEPKQPETPQPKPTPGRLSNFVSSIASYIPRFARVTPSATPQAAEVSADGAATDLQSESHDLVDDLVDAMSDIEYRSDLDDDGSVVPTLGPDVYEIRGNSAAESAKAHGAGATRSNEVQGAEHNAAENSRANYAKSVSHNPGKAPVGRRRKKLSKVLPYSDAESARKFLSQKRASRKNTQTDLEGPFDNSGHQASQENVINLSSHPTTSASATPKPQMRDRAFPANTSMMIQDPDAYANPLFSAPEQRQKTMKVTMEHYIQTEVERRIRERIEQLEDESKVKTATATVEIEEEYVDRSAKAINEAKESMKLHYESQIEEAKKQAREATAKAAAATTSKLQQVITSSSPQATTSEPAEPNAGSKRKRRRPRIGSDALPLTEDGKIPTPRKGGYGIDDDYLFAPHSDEDSETDDEPDQNQKKRWRPALPEQTPNPNPNPAKRRSVTWRDATGESLSDSEPQHDSTPGKSLRSPSASAKQPVSVLKKKSAYSPIVEEEEEETPSKRPKLKAAYLSSSKTNEAGYNPWPVEPNYHELPGRTYKLDYDQLYASDPSDEEDHATSSNEVSTSLTNAAASKPVEKPTEVPPRKISGWAWEQKDKSLGDILSEHIAQPITDKSKVLATDKQNQPAPQKPFGKPIESKSLSFMKQALQKPSQAPVTKAAEKFNYGKFLPKTPSKLREVKGVPVSPLSNSIDPLLAKYGENNTTGAFATLAQKT